MLVQHVPNKLSGECDGKAKVKETEDEEEETVLLSLRWTMPMQENKRKTCGKGKKKKKQTRRGANNLKKKKQIRQGRKNPTKKKKGLGAKNSHQELRSGTEEHQTSSVMKGNYELRTMKAKHPGDSVREATVEMGTQNAQGRKLDSSYIGQEKGKEKNKHAVIKPKVGQRNTQESSFSQNQTEHWSKPSISCPKDALNEEGHKQANGHRDNGLVTYLLGRRAEEHV